MEYIIYKTTNLINGKFYIGRHKTKNLEDGYLGSGRHFLNAVSKHGKENFVREILLHCENEAQMHLAEKIFVVLDSMSYNIARGGKEGGFDYVNSLPQSKEWRRKAAIKTNTSERGKKGYAAVIAKYGKLESENHANFLGKTHSEETKAKIRASHKSSSHPRGPRGPYKKKS